MQGFQDHHVQRPLQNFGFIGARHRSFGHCKEDITTPFQCPKENSLESSLAASFPGFCRVVLSPFLTACIPEIGMMFAATSGREVMGKNEMTATQLKGRNANTKATDAYI